MNQTQLHAVPIQRTPFKKGVLLLVLAWLSVVGLVQGLWLERMSEQSSPAPTHAQMPAKTSVSVETVNGNPLTPLVTVAVATWQHVIVRPGDQLTSIFKRLGLDRTQIPGILALGEEARALARLRPGDMIRIKASADGQIQSLLYDVDPTKTLQIKAANEPSQVNAQAEGSPRFQLSTVQYPLERRIQKAMGTVHSTLLHAATTVGLPYGITLDLANIFGWDIDFALDLRRGDKFVVLYEEYYARGQKVRNGNILAAEIVNRDAPHRAVRYTDSRGHAEYLTPEGRSLRKAFLRSPVDFTRISSGFSLSRLHPVLNRIRAHKGVDYAAPYGTPVKAAGDGQVMLVGNKNGYGKTVILQHGRQYSTLYAHLSGFKTGLRNGQRVRQGDIIGYVGRSGLATGPHLHYEFRVNNEFRNPLTVNLPHAEPLSVAERRQFGRQARDLLTQLGVVPTSLAPTPSPGSPPVTVKPTRQS